MSQHMNYVVTFNGDIYIYPSETISNFHFRMTAREMSVSYDIRNADYKKNSAGGIVTSAHVTAFTNR